LLGHAGVLLRRKDDGAVNLSERADWPVSQGILLSQKIHRPLADVALDRVRQDPGPSGAVLPDARLVRGESFLELRLTLERLTDEIAGFLDECWMPRATRPARKSARVA
jgi:hypothetical protein